MKTEPVAAEAQTCIKCGHAKIGNCQPCANVSTRLCDCECEFPAPQVEGAKTYSIMLARKIVDYLAGTYINPEIALMEVLPIAEIIERTTPQPTPADEEVYVTRHVLWDWKGVESLSVPELDELVKRIATALTEARRQGREEGEGNG